MAEDEREGDSHDDHASETTGHGHDADSGATVGHDIDEGRTTAPMSPFTTRQVGFGLVVLVIGLIVAFGIPILVA